MICIILICDPKSRRFFEFIEDVTNISSETVSTHSFLFRHKAFQSNRLVNSCTSEKQTVSEQPKSFQINFDSPSQTSSSIFPYLLANISQYLNNSYCLKLILTIFQTISCECSENALIKFEPLFTLNIFEQLFKSDQTIEVGEKTIDLLTELLRSNLSFYFFKNVTFLLLKRSKVV